MRLLFVHCHPRADSFGAALRRTVADALRAAGRELPEIDLDANGCDLVFTGGELANIGLFVGITGSGARWLKFIDGPDRSLFMKRLRPLHATRRRMKWLQLYNMNHATLSEREAFPARVHRQLSVL